MSKDKNVLWEEYKKVAGIRGLLIIIAAWIAMAPLFIAANYSNLSQLKIALVRYRQSPLPDEFIEIGYIGYALLFPLSVIMIIALFKRLKIFLLIEVLNLIARSFFLYSLYKTMNDTAMFSNQLANYLYMSVIVSFCTIVYFLISKRAKVTFVEKPSSIFKKKSKTANVL